jgi:hypothetical protein
MHKTLTIAILGLTIVATSGCANGPIRRFFHGAACNSCQPALGQSLWDNDTSPCDQGQCPNGIDNEAFEMAPAGTGVIYGQPTVDPFSGGTIVNPPSNTGVLPGPR